ncbi:MULTISPECIES: helix-turn-helix transcriptional regulator [unclassified Clostridium]|uniref:helix-turn-helix domain-containing protein n=1 Tax=Clostridium TaxID=1485 RepID=UPI001C8C6E75|nr:MULTISPECIES: helix-turn-helix transcriptional regulator [unclassified Clostridium]MBX9138363.1 helix-turn-helix transcriptional regulator [Clostridium sp. K12(2020)]MBX9145079.1 helix-turn-helix transcriptional regulator [Clostridium sp. K13]MDU2290700.1 helix-turn-helix transcriptional regulator [Clostridium celatum]MDU4325415.1 helix-turn-helix transcriptional regulator [Clostridium celatum]
MIDNNNNNTTELDDIINNINSEKELHDYIENKLSPIPTLTFSKYLDSLRISKKIKKSTLIADSDISRTYCYQILNGVKNPSRDNVIKLCLACKLSIDETNRCLTLAKSNKLYSKDIRDSLIIYFINNNYSVIDANIKLDQFGLDILGSAE